ncbi:MAG: ABC transporter permease [Candidatus Marinimicrobia bacterium]|nr:ABC transporter permease [Candidatus Neomarinimicrobiota bacterium]
MNGFKAAMWAEILKARRSKLWVLILIGFSILPLVSGLFMVILKDPVAAKEMGIISMKAQLTAGTADWPSMLGMLAMGTSVAGHILYAIFTAWVFGREFSNRTNKELLALPVARTTIVWAKFVLIFSWTFAIALYIYFFGLFVGWLVELPGWSLEIALKAFKTLMIASMLTAFLQSWVAFFASYGRGYLPAMGWAFFTLALAQILAVMGWGEWIPWSVPAILTEMSGPLAEPLGSGSYLSVILVSFVGVAATLRWWQRADQSS